MLTKDLHASAKRHWFWIALVLVVVLGYQIGKDRALSENAEVQTGRNSR